MNPAVTLSWIAAVLIAIFVVLATHRIPRTKGKVIKYHIFFLLAVSLIVWLCPLEVKTYIFSPLGVIVIGAMFPTYESLRAIASVDTTDDMEWLQYWCGMGIVYFSAGFFNDYEMASDEVNLIWYQFECFYFLWLLLPYTDGSTLLFESVTGPIVAPMIQPLESYMSSWISKVVLTVINASHLYVIWIFFVFLPKDIKRFVTIAVGTVYPSFASVIAVTTPQKTDDTFWLTYWSCYGILFVFMDWSETWLGVIPGFYSVVIFSTVYLMLPMFQGSEKIFRNIIVPLVGLEEQLLLRDAQVLKLEILKNLPPGRQAELRKAISRSFDVDVPDDEEEDKASWTSSRSKRSSIFGGLTKESGTEEEKSSLV